MHAGEVLCTQSSLVKDYNGILVPVRTYQRKVDVDMLNAVKSVLADVSSVSPSSEQRAFTAFSISTSTLRLKTSHAMQPG